MARNADPELFREVFGRFATGVAVITSAGPGGAGGMTANALCSLSLDPLLALVCFENGARTLPIVREAGRFAVNMLAADQEELAGVFASKLPEAEKLDGVDHRLENGVPIIERLARLGGLRAARADRRRRPHDRDRRGGRRWGWAWASRCSGTRAATTRCPSLETTKARPPGADLRLVHRMGAQARITGRARTALTLSVVLLAALATACGGSSAPKGPATRLAVADRPQRRRDRLGADDRCGR